MKLTVKEPISFNITVGRGGDGGGYIYKGLSKEGKSGHYGENGGTTSVNWGTPNITISAGGGMGGGGSGTNTYGGNGGRGDNTALPRTSAFYIDGITADGENGSEGSKKSELDSNGGNAAEITRGSFNPFGGGLGGVRYIGGTTEVPRNGGGGSAGYDKQDGAAGGDGHVIIRVKYADDKVLVKAARTK